MSWPGGGRDGEFGVVTGTPGNDRHIRVEFPAGFLLFSSKTDVLRRVVFPEGARVWVLADASVGVVAGRSEAQGLLTYRITLADQTSRLVAEAGLRSEQAMREVEAAVAERERKEAEVASKAKTAKDEKDRREEARRSAEFAAHAAAEEAARGKAELKAAALGRLYEAFDSDFLGADSVYSDLGDVDIAPAEYEQLKTRYVKDWATATLSEPLDDEQAAAIAASGGDVKVVARAGSGKTRTLITRAIFLQRHCKVSPQQMLLLAFNKKAAAEMRNRLTAVLGGEIPHVMTFHALAYAVVHPEEDILFDDAGADQLGLSSEIQEVIDEHIRSEEHYQAVRDLMLAHFRDDWERIVDRGVQLAISDFMAYRRSLPRESLRGDYVKSFGEREIANTLFENDVQYHYERNHRWNGINYRPDFTIARPGGGVIVEYFGLEGDPDYDEMSEAKRRYWTERTGWTLLEYTPADLVRSGVEGFRKVLLEDLARHGVGTRPKSEEEIWQEIRHRAVDRFTGTIKNFVGRCRKLNLSPDELESLVDQHRPSVAMRSEGLFLDVARSVYAGYVRRLKEQGQEDFDGLLWRAAAEVRAGVTRFARDRGRETGDLAKLRFVMVDEFQDFSSMFAAMLEGVRSVNLDVQFFCVGDDWQAINGYAGADLRYFRDFESPFRDGLARQITTNYRSAAVVVRVGNALMHGRGEAAVPRAGAPEGDAWLCYLDSFTPTSFEQGRHEGDDLTPAILRLVRRFLDRGQDVVLLSRRNRIRGYVKYRHQSLGATEGLDRFLHHIRSFLAKEDRDRVTIYTAHRYKGLEKSAVIVLDGVAGSYPLIHPAWIYLRLFGDSLQSIEDEERRLFYVALTRARQSLAILTEKRRTSPFLSDIRGRATINTLQWESLPANASPDDSRVEVRVSGFEVRDQLKDLGFSYEPTGRLWRRTFPENGFSMADLLGQPWVSGCSQITVHDPTGAVLHTVRSPRHTPQGDPELPPELPPAE